MVTRHNHSESEDPLTINHDGGGALTIAAVASPDSPELRDAFRRTFGKYSLNPLERLITERGGDPATLKRGFVEAMVAALPGVEDGRLRPEKLGVAQALLEARIWNVFHGNAHACGLAATLLHLQARGEESALGARRLMERAVAHYLALVSTASHHLSERYHDLLVRVSSKPTEAEDEGAEPDPTSDESAIAAFREMVRAVEQLLENDSVAELADGIATLIEAILIVREKREEETALTLDLWIPITASWPLFLDTVNKGEQSLLAKAGLEVRHGLLRALPRESIDTLTKQLEDAGKIVGRGVCEMELRDAKIDGKDFIRCKTLWASHDGAPLTLLYALNWRLPDEADPPDVRIVLQANSTVSIFVQGDPLFEYLLGYWSYVDLASKCHTLAKLVDHESADVDELKPTLYRVARFAHQLAYHNHGANIELVFGQSPEQRKKLEEARKRWDITEIDETTGLPLPTKLPGEESPSEHTYGRFAYVLSLNDGLSTWNLSGDGARIYVHDYGRYLPVDDERINETWPAHAAEMGVDGPFSKGGRHRAAYIQSLWKGGQRRVVFCVSQDGYIEVFADGRILRLR
jgi:hypothetical protein